MLSGNWWLVGGVWLKRKELIAAWVEANPVVAAWLERARYKSVHANSSFI